MTKTYDNNKTLFICLIIALLLHILVSLSLFIKFQNSKENSLNKKQETINKLKEILNQKQEISSLKPSPYSAPVIYYDEDELQKPQQTEPKAEKHTQTPVKEIEKKAEPQKDKLIKEKVKEKTEELKQEKQLVKEIPKKEKTEKLKIKKDTFQDRVKIIEKKTEELKKKIAQKIEQTKKTQTQKKPAPKHVQKKETSSEPKIMNAKISAQPTQQTSSYIPSLANLTQSFVQYMNEEGNNQFLERKGNTDKFNPHEAKMVSYYNKIISFFHKCARPQLSTFSNLVENYINLNPGAAKIEVGLKLIINKDGSLADIMLTQNSGFNPYDNHIIKIFQEAAPFPPVPDHLSKDELIFPINIYTPLERQGFSLKIG